MKAIFQLVLLFLLTACSYKNIRTNKSLGIISAPSGNLGNQNRQNRENGDF